MDAESARLFSTRGGERALWVLLNSSYEWNADLDVYTSRCPLCRSICSSRQSSTKVCRSKLCAHLLQHRSELLQDLPPHLRDELDHVWRFVFLAVSAIGAKGPRSSGGRLFMLLTNKAQNLENVYQHMNHFLPFLPHELGGTRGLGVKESFDKVTSLGDPDYEHALSLLTSSSSSAVPPPPAPSANGIWSGTSTSTANRKAASRRGSVVQANAAGTGGSGTSPVMRMTRRRSSGGSCASFHVPPLFRSSSATGSALTTTAAAVGKKAKRAKKRKRTAMQDMFDDESDGDLDLDDEDLDLMYRFEEEGFGEDEEAAEGGAFASSDPDDAGRVGASMDDLAAALKPMRGGKKMEGGVKDEAAGTMDEVMEGASALDEYGMMDGDLEKEDQVPDATARNKRQRGAGLAVRKPSLGNKSRPPPAPSVYSGNAVLPLPMRRRGSRGSLDVSVPGTSASSPPGSGSGGAPHLLLQKRISELEQENARLAANNSDLTKRNARLSSTNSELSARVTSLEADLDSSSRTLTNLQFQSANSGSRIKELERSAAGNAADLEFALDKVKSMTDRIRDLEAELDQKSRELEDMKEGIVGVEETNLRLRERGCILEEMVVALRMNAPPGGIPAMPSNLLTPREPGSCGEEDDETSMQMDGSSVQQQRKKRKKAEEEMEAMDGAMTLQSLVSSSASSSSSSSSSASSASLPVAVPCVTSEVIAMGMGMGMGVRAYVQCGIDSKIRILEGI